MKRITYWMSSFYLLLTATITLAAAQGDGLQNSLQNAVETLVGKMDDAGISTAIAAKYAVDPLLGPFVVKVSTTNGDVKLSGTVDSKTQYQRAITIATDTEGVKNVDAQDLVVTPSESPMSDAYVTFKVKAVLFKDEYFNGAPFNFWNIQVETHNGVVFLVGEVESEDAKNQMLTAVNAVGGVKKVEADLRVVG